MSLKRPPMPRVEPLPPSVLDIEVIEVTRINLMLDTNLPLSFDLEEDDHLQRDDRWLEITKGTRVVRIASSRILYTDTFPAQMKRAVTPKA